jgi:hypothetical protein
MKAPAGCGPSGRDCRRGTASYHHRCRSTVCPSGTRGPLLTIYHAGMFVDAMVLLTHVAAGTPLLRSDSRTRILNDLNQVSTLRVWLCSHRPAWRSQSSAAVLGF